MSSRNPERNWSLILTRRPPERISANCRSSLSEKLTLYAGQVGPVVGTAGIEAPQAIILIIWSPFVQAWLSTKHPNSVEQTRSSTKQDPRPILRRNCGDLMGDLHLRLVPHLGQPMPCHS